MFTKGDTVICVRDHDCDKHFKEGQTYTIAQNQVIDMDYIYLEKCDTDESCTVKTQSKNGLCGGWIPTRFELVEKTVTAADLASAKPLPTITETLNFLKERGSCTSDRTKC